MENDLTQLDGFNIGIQVGGLVFRVKLPDKGSLVGYFQVRFKNGDQRVWVFKRQVKCKILRFWRNNGGFQRRDISFYDRFKIIRQRWHVKASFYKTVGHV